MTLNAKSLLLAKKAAEVALLGFVLSVYLCSRVLRISVCVSISEPATHLKAQHSASRARARSANFILAVNVDTS